MLLELYPPTDSGQVRGEDTQGDGAFGARRGARRHVGVDFAAKPGEPILSPVDGVVLRHGNCYEDDAAYKLIVIDVGGLAVVRVLYVLPTVDVGDVLDPWESIGFAQDLRPRYPGITPHVHLDVELRHSVLAGKDGLTTVGSPLYLDPMLFMQER